MIICCADILYNVKIRRKEGRCGVCVFASVMYIEPVKAFASVMYIEMCLQNI